MDDLETIMKVIVVGNGMVGKSSMITRFAQNVYTDEYKKTLGCDFLEKDYFIKSSGEEIKFNIWDTAGQEEYDALTKKYYRGAQACILAFSTTDRASFDDLTKWRKKVEDQCGKIPMIIVQTKIDLIDEAVMTEDESAELAKTEGLQLFKTCAKENEMVSEVFEHLGVEYLERKKNGTQPEGPGPVSTIQEIKDAGKKAAPKVDLRAGSKKQPEKKKKSGFRCVI